MNNHMIWLLLIAVCIGWYSTITLFVAVRGARDIRAMLRRLKESAD
jgi:hypothetical protein